MLAADFGRIDPAADRRAFLPRERFPSGPVTKNSIGWTKTIKISFSRKRRCKIGSLSTGPDIPPEGQTRKSAPAVHSRSAIRGSVRSEQIITPTFPNGVSNTGDSLPAVLRTDSCSSFCL